MDAKITNLDSANRRTLSEIREALLHLHKTLVESERLSYEKTMGAIHSPSHFLQLLTNDPWFAWLHPFSQIIVAADEALEEKEPLSVNALNTLVSQISRLLVASENGEGFSRHYFDALQENPDVVLSHADAVKLIRGYNRK